MSKRYEFNLVKSAEVQDEQTADQIKGFWYKNQRYFSVNILEFVIEGETATVQYFKTDIDFKGAGKAYHSYATGTGDIHCPCLFPIGETPVVVVRENWDSMSGWNATPFEKLSIEPYNGIVSLLEDVYVVKGSTFLIGNFLYRLGFHSEKTAEGYIHRKFTQKEIEEMDRAEAERRSLFRIAKQKEEEEAKEAAFQEFLGLHKSGKLQLYVQEGDGYSPITGIRIPEAPEGTVYLFAWYNQDDEKKILGHRFHRLTKKHLEAIGLKAEKSVNRWCVWFHAVKAESLVGFNLFGIEYTEYMSAWR